jgi:histone chaperone ASF1
LNNPTSFTSPFQFEITFECFENLPDDLEYKVIYVIKPEDETADMILEQVLVGPVSMGIHTFLLQAEAPYFVGSSNIRQEEFHILGVTALLVTCSYRDQEFCRIGYYVNNEWNGNNNEFIGDQQQQYVDESTLSLQNVVRTILADKPRVTRFPIQWHDDTTTTTTTTMECTPMKHDTTTTTTMETPPLPPMVVSPSSHDQEDMQL